MIYYRCFVPGMADKRQCLRVVVTSLLEAALDNVHIEEIDGKGVVLRRDEYHATVVIEQLAEEELTSVGNSDIVKLLKQSCSVALSPGDDCVPESVYLAWEALYAIAMAGGSWVWLSDRAYGPEKIGQHAAIRPLMLGDRQMGFLMNAEEYSAFLT